MGQDVTLQAALAAVREPQFAQAGNKSTTILLIYFRCISIAVSTKCATRGGNSAPRMPKAHERYQI